MDQLLAEVTKLLEDMDHMAPIAAKIAVPLTGVYLVSKILGRRFLGPLLLGEIRWKEFCDYGFAIIRTDSVEGDGLLGSCC